MIFSVRAARSFPLLLLVLCAGIKVPGAVLDLGIDSRADLDGTLAMRASASTGQTRAVFLYQGQDLSADFFRAGFSCPWLSVGPLAPAGLLRETENPCGYSAGSGVFGERTDLSLDASLPPQRTPALLFEPLPRHLGFFYRTADGGYNTRMGGFAALEAAQFCGVEGLVEVSRPDARSIKDAWYARCAPFAGGLLVHAAGRTVWKASPFSLMLSGGISACELGPPGSFLNSQLAVGGDELGADLLFSLAAKEYVTMDGGGNPDWLSAGGKFHARGPAGSAMLRGSFSLAQEECVPHPNLATRWDFGAVLEKSLQADDPVGARLRMEGEACLDIDAEGEDESRRKLTVGLAWIGDAGESVISGGYGDTGPRFSSSLLFGDRTVSFGVDAEAVFGERRTEVTALLDGRFTKERNVLTLQAGIREVSLTGGTRDLFRRFSASVGWQAGSSVSFP